MSSSETNQLSILRELHRSLDERWRPEDVAKKILQLDCFGYQQYKEVKRALEKVVKSGSDFHWSSMSANFQRPVDMARQLRVGKKLFGKNVTFPADDVVKIEEWIKEVETSIGKRFGCNDFKYDRLPKSERRAQGIDISRRQYNKLFRVAVRLEKKMQRLSREHLKRSLTLASKNRLASRISWEDFVSDIDSACFIAYYVSRCNLRSLFTNSSQTRPYDEICECLMQRCQQYSGSANWWAIAHALPSSEVLQQLDDEQKGVLLAEYFRLMQDAASLLKELWETNEFNDDMVVQRGNDSTTWNITAGAWNKIREGWFSLMYDMGMTDAVEQMCPGKVLRLMAADVAMWHRMSGGDVHPDTFVWKELPRPWEVLAGNAICTQLQVVETCSKHGLDPVKSGWSAPRPGRHIEKFSPTPELVHGVVVSSPILASIFRKAGIFSGKNVTKTVPSATVDEIRSRHFMTEEKKRIESEGFK